MYSLIAFIVIFFMFKSVISADIFGFFYVPSYSHQEFFLPIVKQLSLEGHQVTIITPNPLKDPSLVNLTEIDVSYTYKLSAFITNINGDYKTLITELYKFVEEVITVMFENEELKAIYENPSKKFDLVMVESHSPLAQVFGEIFNAPVIGITSCDALMGVHMSMGSPIHPALYGDLFTTFMHPTVWQKIKNSYNILWFKYHYYFEVLPRCYRKAKQHFGNRVTSLNDKFELLFVNNNHYVHQFKPLAASVISVGLLHVKPAEALPKDLQTIMDEATQGVVYLSFGTNVKSSTLPPHFLSLISKVLSDLPYLILWKWEVDTTSPQLGKNVVTRKWFPQQDILAHPNMKVFVTQGGLQSIEEAISRNVPMVGVPFIADQPMNVERISELKIAEMIDWTTVTEDQLREAIVKVAEKPEYKEKIKEIRDLILDQPMTGLEKAVWWTEYVIRHKGAKHLRSILADTPLWEYLLLDVIAVVIALTTVTSYILYKLMSICKRKLKSYGEVKVKVT